MKLGIVAIVAAVVSAASCRGGNPTATPDVRGTHPSGDPSAPAAATASASSVPTVPAPKPGQTPAKVVIAPPQEVSLPIEVRPSASKKSALLVHADALANVAYVRRIDSQHTIGPVRALAGRQPIALLEGPHPVLLTSRGQDLCFERMDQHRAPACHRLRADFALMVDGAPLLLEHREEVTDDPPPPPRPKRRKRRRAKPQPKKPAVVKPILMRLWAHRFDAAGQVAGKRNDTGLLLKMPLPGMGVIDAAATPTGVRAIYYEHIKPRVDGRRQIRQAKLMSVLLDRDGNMIDRTQREIYRGDRAYGHIEPHRSPRLFGSRVLVGRHVDNEAKPPVNRWEARRLGPVRTVPSPNALLGVDPWRLADPKVVGATELAALTKIYDAAPRLAIGQPPSDAGRVAWVGPRGYFIKKDTGALTSVSRADGALKTEPAPLIVKRSRLHWATMTPDGIGLAQTSAGLTEIRADGTTHTVAGVNHAVLSLPVRIGNDWWAVVPRGGSGSSARSGGAVVRMTSSPAEASALAPHAYADAHVFVGGKTHGLFVAARTGRLTTWALAGDGTARELATVAAGVGSSVHGVARPGGGALLVSRAPNVSQATAVALDAQGHVVGEHPLDLASISGLTLVATPRGAVLLDADQTTVRWLDVQARSVGKTAWPKAPASVACIDGSPARTSMPSATPGQLVAIGPVAGDPCWSQPFPVQLADGSFRWLGTFVDGANSEAALSSLPGPAPPVTPTPSTDAATPRSNARPRNAPCPPDMVSIAGKFCIDRFETQLVDDADGVPLSPDYPTTPGILTPIFRAYAAGRWTMGDLRARSMPLPPLLRTATSSPRPLARSRHDVRPSGFLTWFVADKACKAVGKRLCSQTEWVTACRGEQKRKFPYGDDFKHGQCNVWRFAHPAAALHGNASIGHLDPRLNRVREGDKPLLRHTGATASCASRWGDDAVFDMVGNLDEWFDYKNGAFAGGFYSRTTKKGCEAVIRAHPKRYLDYSLGTRCCAAAK